LGCVLAYVNLNNKHNDDDDDGGGDVRGPLTGVDRSHIFRSCGPFSDYITDITLL